MQCRQRASLLRRLNAALRRARDRHPLITSPPRVRRQYRIVSCHATLASRSKIVQLSPGKAPQTFPTDPCHTNLRVGPARVQGQDECRPIVSATGASPLYCRDFARRDVDLGGSCARGIDHVDTIRGRARARQRRQSHLCTIGPRTRAHDRGKRHRRDRGSV